MNILVGILVLALIGASFKHEEVPEITIAPHESGKLIRDYMEWEFAWAMDPNSSKPSDPPDCGQGKTPQTWFLDGINPRKPYVRECSVPRGAL